MAHHKRKGPKSTRAGCLLCHGNKFQGNKKTARPNVERRLQDKISDLLEEANQIASEAYEEDWSDADLDWGSAAA